MGLGLSVSAFQQFVLKPKEEVFLPPRAAYFSADAVERWQKYLRFRNKMARVGRQTLFFGAVAGIYYGVETAGVIHRDVEDPLNQIAGGVVTGAILGSILPGPFRLRSTLLYSLLGAAAGCVSGFVAQQLKELEPT